MSGVLPLSSHTLNERFASSCQSTCVLSRTISRRQDRRRSCPTRPPIVPRAFYAIRVDRCMHSLRCRRCPRLEGELQSARSDYEEAAKESRRKAARLQRWNYTSVPPNPLVLFGPGVKRRPRQNLPTPKLSSPICCIFFLQCCDMLRGVVRSAGLRAQERSLVFLGKQTNDRQTHRDGRITGQERSPVTMRE